MKKKETTKPNKPKESKQPTKPNKKITFEKAMIDGSKVKDEGYYFKASNGVEVAIHRVPNSSKWTATELSTGKLVLPHNESTAKTIVDAVNQVEKVSPAIKKAVESTARIAAQPKGKVAPKIASKQQPKFTPKKQDNKPTPKPITLDSATKEKPKKQTPPPTVTPVKPTAPKKTMQTAEKRRVYKSLPKNYSVVQGTVAQSDGTILIHNGKPLFKQNKDGTTEQAKDRRGKPAHKVAVLVVDPKAYNQANNARRNAAANNNGLPQKQATRKK